jgi:hypothetical protein
VITAWTKRTKAGPLHVLHLDLTPAVREGRADLVFSLAVLGGLADTGGRVWVTPPKVYTTVELTSVPTKEVNIFKIKKASTLYQGCQIFRGAIYPNRFNIPNDHKIYQSTIKYMHMTGKLT